jgi:hypothetical protein
LELTEDDPEVNLDGQGEDLSKLPNEVVLNLEAERKEVPGFGPCANKKKMKANKWGLILVERNKRNQNTKGSMMQKAMELKQKNKLEITGNTFVALQFDSLNQIAKDTNIKIGIDDHENSKLIDNLIRANKDQYDSFVVDNPEVVLLVDLDISRVAISDSIDVSVDCSNDATPKGSLKEPNSLTWTKVVMRGKARNKSRSRSNFIGENDRCTLEY